MAKIELEKHPYKEKLKQHDKGAWARAELEEDLDKDNPSVETILIAEIMQKLGMK